MSTPILQTKQGSTILPMIVSYPFSLFDTVTSGLLQHKKVQAYSLCNLKTKPSSFPFSHDPKGTFTSKSNALKAGTQQNLQQHVENSFAFNTFYD